MRLNINLATQPYQDIRRYIMRWGIPLLVYAVVSTWFCWHTVRTWMYSRDVNAQIQRVNSEIVTLDQERARAEALLARPENHNLVEQSKLLNQLFARKAFSWTSVFMQLENIMPAQLRVVQIAPDLNQQNQLQLRLVVAGNDREHALELVRRLESSPYFLHPQLRAETMQANAVQFDITALYIPRPAQATNTAEPGNKNPEPAKVRTVANPNAEGGRK